MMLGHNQSGQTALRGKTEVTITASQNNYNPVDNDIATELFLLADTADVDITGLAGGYQGRVVFIQNSLNSTFKITLKHYNASSSEVNKFLFGTTTIGSDYVLNPGEGVLLRQHSASGYWTDYPARFRAGAEFYTIRSVTSGPVAIASNDSTILVDTTAGSITVNLPPVAQNIGRILTFKKMAAANTVTLDGDAAETIDGLATYVWSGVGLSFTIQGHSSGWLVI